MGLEPHDKHLIARVSCGTGLRHHLSLEQTGGDPGASLADGERLANEQSGRLSWTTHCVVDKGKVMDCIRRLT